LLFRLMRILSFNKPVSTCLSTQHHIKGIRRMVSSFQTLITADTPLLPCCRDRFGEQSCQALRRTQPAQFEKRCLNDHDFNTISCCAPVVCRDKHSLSFCRRFKASGMGKFRDWGIQKVAILANHKVPFIRLSHKYSPFFFQRFTADFAGGLLHSAAIAFERK
uniref:DB domain-containing protein n=1 Tax=Heligmosomoides polygyrus TaxID=6339 RepID=A0A183FVA3_HELPZ